MSRTLALAGFIGCAMATLGGFLWLARLAAALPGGGAVEPLLPLFLLLLVPALLAAWLLPRVGFEGGTFLLVLLVGVLIRALFLPIDPGLSDDAYRYLWDGRVQIAGMNPYGVAPIDPALDGVERDWPVDERVRHRVNHEEFPTIYPPLAQHLFAVVAALAGGMFAWKLVILAAEVLFALLIVRALELVGRDPRAVLLYLWHPLPIVEVAWNAHVELIAAIPLLWCAVLLVEKRRVLSGIALGGAIAAKLWPAGFGLVLLRRGGIVALAAAAATVAWLTVPFIGVDPETASAGLREYAGSWYFNDLVFRPLGEWLDLDPENRAALGARGLRIALLLGWAAFALATSKRPPLVAALLLAGSFVLLSPTVHPWYLLFVLPLAVVLERWGWWLLSGTVLLAYEVQIEWRVTGVWEEAGSTRWLVYAAPLGLMSWALLREAQERRRLRQPPEPRVSPDARSESR